MEEKSTKITKFKALAFVKKLEIACFRFKPSIKEVLYVDLFKHGQQRKNWGFMRLPILQTLSGIYLLSPLQQFFCFY